MRPGRGTDDATGGSAKPRVVPLRGLERIPIPEDLADAIGAVLEARERATDHAVRIALAIRIRCALEAWLDGAMSDEKVVRVLRGERRDDAT